MVGLAAATDDEANQEALEDEAFNAAMESAELDGLEGEEAELAAWERAAEALADRMDGNRQTMARGGLGLEVDMEWADRTLMQVMSHNGRITNTDRQLENRSKNMAKEPLSRSATV